MVCCHVHPDDRIFHWWYRQTIPCLPTLDEYVFLGLLCVSIPLTLSPNSLAG
jgi:hypothetical protein